MTDTPNMNLTLPTIDVTTDPTWSEEINSNFNILDAHDHITVGKNIITAAINIDDDLTINGYNLIDIRSLQLQSLSSDPALAGDINCPYVKDGNLWFNNASGAHVQITNGTGLNLSVGVDNVFSSLSVAANYTLLNTDPYTWLDVSGAQTIFLPAASTVSAGRFVWIKDVDGTSETNIITITPNGSDTIDGNNSDYYLKKNFGTLLLECDGVSAWKVSNSSNIEMNNGTFRSIGQDMLIAAAANHLSLTADNGLILDLNGSTGDGYIDAINFANTFSGNYTISCFGYGLTCDSLTATAASAVIISGATCLVGSTGVIGIIADTDLVMEAIGGSLTLSGGTDASITAPTLAVNSTLTIEDGYQLILNGSLNYPQFGTPITINNVQSYVGGKDLSYANKWTLDPASYFWYQANIADTYEVAFDLDNLIVGSSFTTLTARVSGSLAGASHSALPASMPILYVYRMDLSGPTLLGSQVDTSSTFGIYDTSHTIVCTLTSPETVLNNRVYFAVLRGESGANSVAFAFGCTGLHASMTVSQLTPG